MRHTERRDARACSEREGDRERHHLHAGSLQAAAGRQAAPAPLQSAAAVHKLRTNPGVLPPAASSLQRSGDENTFLGKERGAREGLGNERTEIETGGGSLG